MELISEYIKYQQPPSTGVAETPVKVLEAYRNFHLGEGTITLSFNGEVIGTMDSVLVRSTNDTDGDTDGDMDFQPRRWSGEAVDLEIHDAVIDPVYIDSLQSFQRAFLEREFSQRRSYGLSTRALIMDEYGVMKSRSERRKTEKQKKHEESERSSLRKGVRNMLGGKKTWN